MQGADNPLMSSDNKDEEKSHLLQRLQTRALQAWRFTVVSGALGVFLILLVNIIIFAVMYSKFSIVNYTITFYTGSCQTASIVITVSQIIINILSTLLLSSSNFSMQCLASPFRKEIDSAHTKKHWLSIGVSNICNLFFVLKPKVALWFILAISSFPLHMLWNSTAFQTLATKNYLAVSVTEDFLHGSRWTIPNSTNTASNDVSIPGADNIPCYHTIIHDLQQKSKGNELEFLDVRDCQKAYGRDDISDRRHVLLVVNEDNTTFFFSTNHDSNSSV